MTQTFIVCNTNEHIGQLCTTRSIMYSRLVRQVSVEVL